MKDLFEALRRSSLGAGLEAFDDERLSRGLSPRLRNFRKGDVLHPQGEAPILGLIVSGAARVETLDEDGTLGVITLLSSGDLWGLAELSAGAARSDFSVTASQDGSFALLDWLEAQNSNDEELKGALNAAALPLLARKNKLLTRRLSQLSQRTLRRKIIETLRQGALTALSRQDLADYLAVDRSALSRELSRMAKEGLITLEGRQVLLNE